MMPLLVFNVMSKIFASFVPNSVRLQLVYDSQLLRGTGKPANGPNKMDKIHIVNRFEKDH